MLVGYLFIHFNLIADLYFVTDCFLFPSLRSHFAISFLHSHPNSTDRMAMNIGFIVAVLFNFFMNKKWTFAKSSKSNSREQFIKFFSFSFSFSFLFFSFFHSFLYIINLTNYYISLIIIFSNRFILSFWHIIDLWLSVSSDLLSEIRFSIQQCHFSMSPKNSLSRRWFWFLSLESFQFSITLLQNYGHLSNKLFFFNKNEFMNKSEEKENRV